MSSNGDKPKRKKRFGIFILGWFVGFICTILILAGVGFWAYNNVSIKTIEKWTKSDITNNEDIENKTVKDWVTILNAIGKTDAGAYTIAKFEEDFNVKLFNSDKIYGFDLTKIRNSPITQLKTAIDDTISDTTFTNVLSFLKMEQDELGMLSTVLNSEKDYFIHEGKLYTDKTYAKQVDFKYTINGDNIEIANGTYPIVEKSIDGSDYRVVAMCLSNLPLDSALANVEDATKDLAIWEVLGYTRTGTAPDYVYKDNGVEVTGIMASLAKYSVGDLSNSETFEGIYLYEVLGYTREGGEGSYIYKDNGVEVTGVLKALAGKTVKDLSNDETFTGMTVAEVMDYHKVGDDYYDKNDAKVTGVLKVLANKTINDLSNNDTFTSIKIYEVLDYTREGEAPNYIYKNNGVEVTGIMKSIADCSLGDVETRVNTMPLWEMLGYTRTGTEGNYVYMDGENEVGGIIKVLAEENINSLQTRINNLEVWEVMGYTREGEAPNYIYKDGETEITGIMKAIASTKVNDLDSKIKDLKAVDVFDEEDTPILRLFIKDYGTGSEDRSDLEKLKLIELPNQVVEVINSEDTKIGKLIDAGIIKVSGNVSEGVREMTIAGLIESTAV